MISQEPVSQVGKKVRAFYEACSFPGYEDVDTPQLLLEKANRGVYARVLGEQLPFGVRILDAGCGTGQLAIFLSLVHRTVVGADFSWNSLQKANEFKREFGLKNVHFLQMDLFSAALQERSFDYVFCDGVLHHTADAYGGFQRVCRLLKPGGFITIGLYNTYGRLLLDLRRKIFCLTGRRLHWLDYFVRRNSGGEAKKQIWFADQYQHPHEEKFSVADVLRWFRENGISYVNSIPSIRLGEQLSPKDHLFAAGQPGSPLENLLCEFGWILTKGREGGFFLTIGQKVV